MMFVVFMLLILKTAQALQGIQVSCGQLQIDGYSSCEIKHDNDVLTYTGPTKEVLIGPLFGLIEYRCDQTAGYMMSEIDCEGCNFECSDEEQPINSCETDTAQFWTGVISGGLLSILLGRLLWNRFYPTSNKIFQFKCKTQSESSVNVIFANDQVKIKKNKEENRRSRKTLASVFAGLLCFKTAEACDVLIMIADSNNVTAFCLGSDCGTHPGYFTMRHGNEICLEDHFGERVSFQVSEVVWRYRYELAYYTSDYATSLTFASKCCATDIHQYTYCSATTGPCETGALDALKEKASNIKGAQLTCESSKNPWSSGRNFSMCAYVREPARKGELYSVFERKSYLVPAEMITLIVKSGDHMKKIKMQSFDPTYKLDLTEYKLQGVDKVELSVLEGSMIMEDSRIALIQHDNRFYYNGGFGDCKINVRNTNEVLKFSEPQVKCELTGYCDCHCALNASESQVNTFLSQKDSYRQANNITVRKNDSSVVIDTFETAENNQEWKLTMRLGSLTVSDFKIMNGKCDVTVLGNFGCSACNESAYVVLETKNIENEGLMPFQSNCSFNRNSIRCGDEPTRLVLTRKENTCYIKLLATNKMTIVNLRYSVFGHQIKAKHWLNCTKTYSGYGEVLAHFLTAAQLLKAFFGTMFTFAILGLFAKLILILLGKWNQDLNTPDKQDDLVDL